jgi:hypothetical protein
MTDPDETAPARGSGPHGGWGWFDYALTDCYGPRIGAAGIAVYIVLARHAGALDQSCHPSYATIAEKAGLDRRTVIAVVAALEREGLIRKAPRSRRGPAGRESASNRYTLLPLPPPSAPPAAEGVPPAPPAPPAPAGEAPTRGSDLMPPGGDLMPPGSDLMPPGSDLTPPGSDLTPPGGDLRPPEQDVVNKTSENKTLRNNTSNFPRASAARGPGISTGPGPDSVAGDAPPFSAYIAAVTLDICREIGDRAPPTAGVTRALRLWAASGLPEAEFVERMHATRASLRRNQTHIAYRGAWFFTALAQAVAGPPPDE